VHTRRRHVDNVRMRLTPQLDLVLAVPQTLALPNWATHELGVSVRGWRWQGFHLWLRWRGFRHGPHVHGDGPVGLDHGLPDLWEDDFAVGSDKVVVAFVDVRANDVDVEEGLLDELFHALRMSV
jgi:hypothetical protein